MNDNIFTTCCGRRWRFFSRLKGKIFLCVCPWMNASVCVREKRENERERGRLKGTLCVCLCVCLIPMKLSLSRNPKAPNQRDDDVVNYSVTSKKTY